MVAVGIGLAWGRGGMLTLGQGVFFGIGAYLMAMHLKLADAGPGGTPDFMALISSDGVPGWWEPFRSGVVTILAILLLPALVAGLLGLATFRRRVRGAYFAILSQALAAAFAILLVGNPTATGGSTGLNNFRGFFGFNLYDPVNKQMLFFIAAGVLLAMVALVRQLMVSRYGELLVACRDAEERVRFLGYDPANVKTVGLHDRGVHGRHRRGAVRPDRRHRLAQRRGHRPVDRFPHRGGDRRADHAARAGARCDRRGVGGHDPLGDDSLGLDLHPGLPVHAGHRVPARRPGVAGRRLERAARPVAQAATAEPDPGRPGRADRGERLMTELRANRCHSVARASADRAQRGRAMSVDYLEITDLTVSFDGFVAVDSVNLSVLPGDLRFLIGPNGAGKTTLIDAVSGLVKATGSARFGGHELVGQKVHRIARLGVGRTFQTATVFEELTVLQNLDIAAGRRRGALTLLRRRSGVPDEVAATLETIGLTDLVDVPAGILPHGQKQWLEIGMLLVQDAKLLMLDEPVAGMSAEEKDETGRLLQRIAEERTVVIVEHDMDFMRAFAKSVTVLHAGKVLSEGSVAAVQADPRVQEVYLGPGHHSEDEVAAVLGEGRDMKAPCCRCSTSRWATAAPR